MIINRETLLSSESVAATNAKVRKFAARFLRYSKAEDFVTLVGAFSSQSLGVMSLDGLVDTMTTWCREMRRMLVECGIWMQSIDGYLVTHPVPIIDDIIILTWVSDAQRIKAFDGAALPPSVADGGSDSDDDDEPPEPRVKGHVVIDPFSGPGPFRPGRNLDVQVEVTVWDDDHGIIGRKLPGEMKLTLNTSQTRIEEMGAELSTFKKTLKDKLGKGKDVGKSPMFKDTLRKVELSLKVSGKVDFDQSTARRLVSSFSTQLKGSLEADVVPPGTDFKLHVEGTLGVNQIGKPVFELNFQTDF